MPLHIDIRANPRLLFFSLLHTKSRMQEDGVPVTSMKPHPAYYAKRSVEKQHVAVYTEKFLSLPRFLHDTQAKNPGTCFKFTAHPDNTGVFRGVFVCFSPAATLLRSFGRNVCGADFGHSSSYVFEGVYAWGGGSSEIRTRNLLHFCHLFLDT